MDVLQHEWVRLTITPVSIVIPRLGGDPIISVDPGDEVDAKAGSAYGCNRCKLPLAEGINQLCTPEEGTQ